MKILFTASLFLVAACHSMRPDLEVPTAMLAYVPESGQRDIESARQQLDDAKEELTIARRDTDEADGLLQIAQSDLDVATAHCDEAVEQAAHAERYGTAAEHAAAMEHRADARAAVRAARASIRYYEDLLGLAEQRQAWLRERVEYAEMQLQLRQAEAISKLDRPAARAVDVPDHREAAANVRDDVQRRAMEVQVANLQARLQADFVARVRNRVPADLRPQQLRSIDDVFVSQIVAEQPDPLLDT